MHRLTIISIFAVLLTAVIAIPMLLIRRKRRLRLVFTLFFPSFTIQTNKMTVKRSQFPITGQVKPTNDAGEFKMVQTGTIQLSTDNENVEVVPNPEDETKFSLQWTGPGKLTEAVKVKVTATADADLGEDTHELSDSLEIDIEADPVNADEATKLNLSLNL